MAPPPEDVEGMTIDELARRSGVTTRNIRAYQTRGLLPPPRLAGRVGHYDEGHLARLAYIGRLQDRGFSLAAIRDLLGGWEEGRSLGDVLGFEQALTAPWSDEVPERFTPGELLELFPAAGTDPAVVPRVVELGLLAFDEKGLFSPQPRMLRVGAELVALGIPLPAVVDAYVGLADDMARVAARMVRMFQDHVWEPFVAAGLPAERLPEVTRALTRIRPLASKAVVAALAAALDREVTTEAAQQAARFVPPEGFDQAGAGNA